MIRRYKFNSDENGAEMVFTLLIAVIILTVIIIIFLLFKMEILYPYQEEYVVKK